MLIEQRIFRINSFLIAAILMVMLTTSSLAAPIPALTSTWQITTVDDSGSLGDGNSIAIAPNGYPHISYYDDSNYSVKHAYQDEAGWHVQVIMLQDDYYSYSGSTSIAIDQDGFAHVSFQNPNPAALMYAEQDDLGWTVITVTLETDMGFFTSLALDRDGNAHIAFSSGNYPNGTLQFASQVGNSWQIETVESTSVEGTQRSLALASDGTPHISYQKEDALWYATRDTEGWHLQQIAGGGWGIETGSGSSLALDSQGNPHIVHNYYNSDSASSSLLYEYQDAQGWHRETVDDHINTSGITSIALDSEDNPHVSYFFGWPNTGLAYAYRSSAGWHYELVETGGTTFGSLALKDGKFPHISYQFYSSGYTLKYAYLPTTYMTFVPFAVK